MKTRILAISGLAVLLGGCALHQTTQRLATVRIGMDKAEVRSILGKPLWTFGNPPSSHHSDDTEYWAYHVDTSTLGTGDPNKVNYYIRWVHDKVDAYGDYYHLSPPPSATVQDFYRASGQP